MRKRRNKDNLYKWLILDFFSSIWKISFFAKDFSYFYKNADV